MRLPGFTATAALGPAEGQYRTDAGVTRDEGRVQPAFRRGPGCMASCLADQAGDPFAYENCHCICYGRPGHTCWLV